VADDHQPPQPTGVSPIVPLIAELAGELARAGIRYCHWKSTAALDRSVSGENDLDLLVDRSDVGGFLACIHRLGFRAARPVPSRQVPGLLDFYGFDRPTRRVVHLQLHTQLVLGDDLTKNYRLPIEAPYLDDLDRTGVLPVPRPELEYLVLVLRLTLKHCPWDAQLARKGRATATERAELCHLERRLDPEVLGARLRQLLPFVEPALFERCREAVRPGSGPVQRAVAAAGLHRALAAHGRRSPSVDTLVKARRRLLAAVARRAGGLPAKRAPDTGGLVVAVVGGDGSGKSSTVDAVVAHLGPHLAVHRSHLGKPPRSLATRTLRRALRRWRSRGRLSELDLRPWEHPVRFPGYWFLAWHLAIGRDRQKEHRRIRRRAGRGAIVVCDRWPLLGIRTMDVPRTSSLPGAGRRPLARMLARWERRCYAQILPPDVLIVLRVPPEVACRRRADQDPGFVARRAEEIWSHPWGPSGAVVLDASRPLDEVVDDALSALWAHL
jgi:thymidylate kinase